MANQSFEQLLVQYRSLLQRNPQSSTTIFQLFAQTDATSEFSDLFDQAKQCIQRAVKNTNWDDAERAVELVWLFANHTHNEADKAQAHWCSGMLHANRNVRLALEHAQAAFAFFQANHDSENQARISIGIASQLNLLGRLNEAEEAIQQAVDGLKSNPTYRDWPIIYINLSYIQCQQGSYQQSIESAVRAIEITQRLSKHYPERSGIYRWQEAQARVNQGRALLHLADFQTAQPCLTTAFDLAQQLSAGWIAGRAALHLARIHGATGQLVEGLQWAQRAHQLFAEAGIQIDLATTAIEEANLYSRLHMFHLARQAASTAADTFHDAEIATESVEARLIVVRLSLMLNEPQTAQKHLDIVEELIPHTSRLLQLLWHAFKNQFRLRAESRQIEDALMQVEAAQKELARLGAEQETIEAGIISAELQSRIDPALAEQQFRRLAERAHALALPHLEQQCYEQWANRLPADAAIMPLQKAAQIVSQTRRTLPFEELKANLLTGHSRLYSRLAEAQLAVGDFDGALQTLLEAKGSIWLELLNHHKQKDPSAAWHQARATLDFWQDELRQAAEPDFVTLCQSKIEQSKQRLALEARLQRVDNEQELVPNLPSLTEIYAHLPVKSVAIEYLCGSQSIWACVLTADQGTHWIELGAAATVKRTLSTLGLLLATMQRCQVELRLQAAKGQQKAIATLFHQLYELLWLPFETLVAEAEQIYIAPHDYLFELPWNALWNGDRYLGQEKSICLLPSIGLLKPVERPAEQAHSLLLGYAGDPPLQFIESELRAIKQVIPAAKYICPAPVDSLAKEQTPRFLHIAAHGQINRREPLFSRLQFADGDYLLADVLNLDLQGTELVTLSACETSTVPEHGGVLLALAGAFLCAGAQTTLASLWKVDDQATQILMQQLYSSLQQGQTISSAVQQAQQAVYQAGFEHPYFWAAFQPLSRAI